MQALTKTSTVLDSFMEGETIYFLSIVHGVEPSEIEECRRWQMRQRAGK